VAEVRSRVGQFFDPATAAEDARRIAELSGVEYSYYNTAMVDGKVQLTFVVVERNIVRSIYFVGNRKYKDKTLREKLDFKTGEYLDPIRAQSAIGILTEFYYKKGFLFVQVTLDVAKLDRGEVIYSIDEGPRVKIDALKFNGNKVIKTKALRKVIKIEKTKWFFLSSYYSEEKAAEDVTRLQKAYQKKGFLDADIAVKREFNAKKNKVRLTFTIEEGLVYTVEGITITGMQHFDEQQLQAQLKLKQGQVYSEQKAESDVKRLLGLYRENGFIDVQVTRSRRFASESGVDVGFEIREGRRFRIGRVIISGNEQTRDKVIRRVLDEYDFQPGQWYNADMARPGGYLEGKIRRRVLTEAVTIMPSGGTADHRDAQVNIVEGQTGSVMVGAGVASDSGVIGQLVFQQNNFDITDKPESFHEFITGQAFKGAGQNLRISLMPGTEVSTYSVSFVEPYLKDKPISLSVTASSYERWRESYDEKRTKGYVGFEKRYKNDWRRSVGFRLENIDVADIDYDAPKEITDVEGDNVLAGIMFGVGRDTTDYEFNPSAGYRFNTSYEQLAGDHTFGIVSATYSCYRTLREDLAERKTILATKLHAATVVGDAPPFEKFYAGGQASIRGFDYRGISTRGLQQNVAEPKRKDPIGSDWIFLANAEVVVPLVSDNFAVLFFVDSGTIDTGGYRAAAGTGIQILIPRWFGPVPMRFELAAPLMKDGDDETQVFSFSMGRMF
jgi:outer membrane protein insertion porin family